VAHAIEKIPMNLLSGMFFQISAGKGLSSEIDEPGSPLSFVCHGQAFGVASDLRLWHQHVRHMSMQGHSKTHKQNPSDGFKLRGQVSLTSCYYDWRKQAETRRIPEDATRAHPSAATFVSARIAKDNKEVPYVILHGYRYVIVFVDNFSAFTFAYFLTGL
jgi:hypothetical protein